MEFSPASFQIISDLLSQRTGQYLSQERTWRLGSAMAGVFRAHGLSNLDQLVSLLENHASCGAKNDIATQIVEALLNNETYFFRDKPTFDQIPKQLLPQLRRQRQKAKHLSIWCAGCSTGQEVHSLAMVFEEQAHIWQGWTIEILGTDVSAKAIAAARNAVYGQFDIQRGLGVRQILDHFDETSNGWSLKQNLRGYSSFRQHNVLSNLPAATKFDLILCRNVLLYFDEEKRDLAFNRLASALANDGLLMLGNGETLDNAKQPFAPSNGHASVFEHAT